jgi:enoyl-CoA hydratase/carnithine racemase
MQDFGTFGDVKVELADAFVAHARIVRPPNNFFDRDLIASLADAFEALDAEAGCRAIVLGSEGRHFCAGANFASRAPTLIGSGDTHLYDEAVRLFSTRTPCVAAVQGAAIGGGLGLALAADFRVCSPEARFSANFARLGIHQGFGLSVTLPRVVGNQMAMELLYTGRRIDGVEAHRIGLADRLATGDLLAEAVALAEEVAGSAPLAVDSIRNTLRGNLAAQIRLATDHEKAEQERLQKTSDFREGTRAMGERRKPVFEGR